MERLSRGIGGTDSPIILGVAKHKRLIDLWAEKRGLIPEEEQMSPHILRGRYLEDIVSKIYEEQLGRKLRRKNRLIFHKKYNFLVGRIDRETKDSIVEIKCPSLPVFLKIKRLGPVPEHVVQLQHYLLITGKQWGSLAVFSAEKWELLNFDIEADKEIQQAIIDRGKWFWDLVLNGEPPPEEPEEVIEIPKEFASSSPVRLDDDPTFLGMFAELLEIKGILEEAETLYDQARERVKNYLLSKSITAAEASGARVYIRQNPPRVTYDVKKLMADRPDMVEVLEQYKKQGKPYETITIIKLKNRTEGI